MQFIAFKLYALSAKAQFSCSVLSNSLRPHGYLLWWWFSFSLQLNKICIFYFIFKIKVLLKQLVFLYVCQIFFLKISLGWQVQFSHSVLSDSLRPHEPQHTRPPCPSPTPGVHPNPCPLSRWCHPTILSSVVPFSSCPQTFPASGSFPRSQFFELGGQSIGVSVSASVPPVNIKDWFPLGLTGWDSLQSKGLSRVFSNTTVQKHQFFLQYLNI